MTNNGTNTYREIKSQPQVWREALNIFQGVQREVASFWETNPVDYAIFTGCGSTYYLSITGAALLQSKTGIMSLAKPGSDLILSPEICFPTGKRGLLIASSRSGETTETLEAIQSFRKHTNGKVLAITCDSNSSMALSADLTLAIDAAQEVSFAQTRSFSSMAVIHQALAGHLSGIDVDSIMGSIPDRLESILVEYEGRAKELGESPAIDRFFFLGSGTLYGIALEGMLKMKEMSISYSEAYHPLEFRHGPMSMVSPSSLVIGLLMQDRARHEGRVLTQMKSMGGQILALSDQLLTAGLEIRESIDLQATQYPDWARPVLYLPLLQLIAYYRALLNRQNPDQPKNVTAVVRLDPF